MASSSRSRSSLNMNKKPRNRGNRFQGENKLIAKKEQAKPSLRKSRNSMAQEEKKAYVGNKMKTYIVCSPLNFRKKLDEIPQETLNILKDSPFKSLLQLKGDVLSVKLVKKLASDFDWTQTKLGDHPLGEDDFSAIMGIQSGNDAVVEVVPILDKNLSRKFCSYDAISMTKVMEILTKEKDETTIKQAFVLLALKYIICPSSRRILEKRYLHYVKDVNGLNKMPWAALAMDALRKGIQMYQKTGKGKDRNLGGCVLFLQLYCMNGYKSIIQNGRSIILDVDATMTRDFFNNWKTQSVANISERIQKEVETVVPTPKRKRDRPSKLPAILLENSVAGYKMKDAQKSASSAKPLEQPSDKNKSSNNRLANVNSVQDVIVQRYPSMKGKQGKRRRICIDTEDSGDKADNDHNTLTRNSEILMLPPPYSSFGDKFPFKMINPTLWNTIKSMEAFQKIPQKPHFRPLESMNESSREGIAFGSMVTYLSVVEKTCALKFEDPRNTIEECLETLSELENHGFDVDVIRDRLTRLLYIKKKHEELELEFHGLAAAPLV